MSHDLNQRHTAPVKIEMGMALATGCMDRLPGIFLKVNPENTNNVRTVLILEDQFTICRQRLVVLRDLISLR